MKNVPQHSDSKISTTWVDSHDEFDIHPCERVPYSLLAQWNALQPLTTDMILAGEQHPPLATYLAAPSMGEAIMHQVRVTNALDYLQRVHLDAR